MALIADPKDEAIDALNKLFDMVPAEQQEQAREEAQIVSRYIREAGFDQETARQVHDLIDQRSKDRRRQFKAWKP